MKGRQDVPTSVGGTQQRAQELDQGLAEEQTALDANIRDEELNQGISQEQAALDSIRDEKLGPQIPFERERLSLNDIAAVGDAVGNAESDDPNEWNEHLDYNREVQAIRPEHESMSTYLNKKPSTQLLPAFLNCGFRPRVDPATGLNEV